MPARLSTKSSKVNPTAQLGQDHSDDQLINIQNCATCAYILIISWMFGQWTVDNGNLGLGGAVHPITDDGHPVQFLAHKVSLILQEQMLTTTNILAQLLKDDAKSPPSTTIIGGSSKCRSHYSQSNMRGRTMIEALPNCHTVLCSRHRCWLPNQLLIIASNVDALLELRSPWRQDQ